MGYALIRQEAFDLGNRAPEGKTWNHLRMAHFPQTVASTRSPRVSLQRPIPIDFRLENGLVRGDLHVVSATGGRARTSKPVVPGSVVELRMGTSEGPVRGIVEMLKARQMIHGWVQPFRFLALADEDFDRLKKVLAAQ